MKIMNCSLALGTVLLACANLSGCGGGSSGTTASAQLTGTAATGAALAYASVQVKDSSGNNPCVESSITTTGTGSYTCTLKSGETAPFFVLVTDPSGQLAPLVSVATETPAAGTPLVLNATPLTTAIVAQANGGDAVAAFTAASINSTDLANARANVLAQLKPVLDQIVGANSGYDPFKTAITAANSSGVGNTADQVLDVLKFSTTANGALAVSTIDNTTPVLLATATPGNTGGGTLAAPSVNVSDLVQAGQLLVSGLTDCFAKTPAQRVLHVNTTWTSYQGGPEVDSVDPACTNMAASSSNGGAVLPFRHNGYSGGQFFYNLMNDSNMTGASFSVPEVVLYFPANASSSIPLETHNRALINIRYLDNQNNPGNLLTWAAELSGTSTATRATNWWLVGNQHLVDIGVRPQFRRQTQYSSSGTTVSFPAYNNFRNGLQFQMNTTGPGTDQFDHVYITGNGLPSTGVWLKKSTFTINAQSTVFFDLMQYRQTSPGLTGYNGTTCGGTQAYDCNVFWFSTTSGISGTDATTLVTNPTTNKRWTQPGDGAYDGASQGTRPLKGASYSVRFFNGSTEVTALAMTKVLTSDVIPATLGANLPWNTPGNAIADFLNPSGSQAGALPAGTAVTINWVQNVAAPQVAGVNIWTSNGTQSGALQYGWDGSVSVARGVTSKTVTPVFAIDALGTGSRAVLLGHRTMDGSGRQDVFAYN